LELWSFFEPAYGTGPEDGVDGEVKRAMWPSFLKNITMVTTAEKTFARKRHNPRNST